MRSKELEIQGCRTFVCPNLSILDEKGKELFLQEETIKYAKELAVIYLKKTYHTPHYSHIKYLLPSFIYVASILKGEKRIQQEISDVFGINMVTIRKWNEDIVDTLELEIIL